MLRRIISARSIREGLCQEDPSREELRWDEFLRNIQAHRFMPRSDMLEIDVTETKINRRGNFAGASRVRRMRTVRVYVGQDWAEWTYAERPEDKLKGYRDTTE